MKGQNMNIITTSIILNIARVVNKIGLITIAAFLMLVCGCRHSTISNIGQKDTNTIPDLPPVSVVIFGMERSKAGNCPGSELDARRFQQLMNKLGYGGSTKMFLNEAGTIYNFQTEVEKAVMSDLAIIYYSGHGGSDESHRFGTGENEDDGIDEFLCLYDGYYLDDDIWNIVSKSKGRVLMIFDCCHSKTMFRSPPMGEFAELMYARADGQKEQFSLLCWSGCPDNTYSYGSNEGGFFTSTMLKYWRPGMTYNQLWRLVSVDANLSKAQICQQTQAGGEWDFNREAFR